MDIIEIAIVAIIKQLQNVIARYSAKSDIIADFIIRGINYS